MNLSSKTKSYNRRQFGNTGVRLGGLAMASMLADSSPSPSYHGLPHLPHFAGKVKAVIYLHMNGGPSQLDTWDYKPNSTSSLKRIYPNSSNDHHDDEPPIQVPAAPSSTSSNSTANVG